MKYSFFCRGVIIFLAVSFFISPLTVPSTFGLSFDPEKIISDEDFFHSDDMSLDDIQHFLERKESTLAHYTVIDSYGRVRTAADIIWSAAHTNSINPKVLLVTLQKEQSLIENPNPSQYNYDWATGFARCDSCSPDSPTVSAYKGFAVQVEKAAWRSQYYVSNANQFTYRNGVQSSVDGISIIPKNNATAALYNYTPHFRGNFSFWKLWQRYFGKVFPDGMVVQESDSPDVWLIQDGKKRKFTSMSVLLSRYQTNDVALVNHGDLDTYLDGPPIRFSQYSLLQTPNGGIFLIVGDGKYAIPSKKIFRDIGFNPDEVIQVTAQDVTDIPTVGIVSSDGQSPIGELLQDKQTGGIFSVSLGKKHPILERAVLETNFPYMKPRLVSADELAGYTTSDPVLFADGSLVKTPLFPTVYIISHGQRRPIASEEAFDTLGFQWSHVVVSTGDTLSRHAEGEPIDIGRIINEDYPSPLKSATLK